MMRGAIRYWTYANRGEVKVTVPRGRAIWFQCRETTAHGATLLETNSIAFDGTRLMWSWSRIEINRGHVDSWQGAYEAIVDRDFHPRDVRWDVAIEPRRMVSSKH